MTERQYYLDQWVFGRTSLVVKLFAVPIIIGYLLLFPNLILHYSEEIKTFVKYPLLVVLSLLLFVFGIRHSYKYIAVGMLVFLMCLDYSMVTGIIGHQYWYQGMCLVLIAAVFYRYQALIGLFMKLDVLVAVVISMQALIVAFAWYFSIPIQYDPHQFVGIEIPIDINPWLGSNGIVGYVVRPAQYFTEANRLAYFLTPPFFFSYYLSKNSSKYVVSTAIIALALVSTFSVAGMTAAFSMFYLYKYNTIPKKIRIVLLVLVLIFPIIVAGYLYNPEYWHFAFGKAGSARVRWLGLLMSYEVLIAYPGGVGLVDIWAGRGPEYENARGTLALMHWLRWGGLQVLLFVIPLLIIYLTKIFSLMRSSHDFERVTGYALLAYFLEQSFFGDYFEFYFVVMMAVGLALASLKSRLRKFNQEQGAV